MPELPYDVFLSHSKADAAVVRSLAERLRADGLSIWYNEWMVCLGDILRAIHSRRTPKWK